MKLSLLNLCGLLLIISCSNPGQKANVKKETSSVVQPYRVEIEANLNNIKSVSLSDVGKQIEYIPLETNAKSLINRISKIEFSKNYIFISDFYRLTQFDRKGNFIRQVGSNGKGPGEYLYVLKFYIDEKSERVYIIAAFINTVLEFDFYGTFIRSFKYSFRAGGFLKTDSNNFVFEIPNAPNTKDSEYRLISTDSTGTIKAKFRNHNRFINQPILIFTDIPMYYFKDTVRILESHVDTLNSFINPLYEPYAIFNLGQSKLNPDIPIAQRSQARGALKDKLSIAAISENKEYFFIRLMSGLLESNKLGVFNKQTGETAFLDRDGFINDLDNGLTFWPKYVYDDSLLVDYLDASEILETIQKNHALGSEKMLSKGLTETSNPVIIVVK
jgi:hypothetical protein